MDSNFPIRYKTPVSQLSFPAQTLKFFTGAKLNYLRDGVPAFFAVRGGTLDFHRNIYNQQKFATNTIHNWYNFIFVLVNIILNRSRMGQWLMGNSRN
ncbi:MAG: hypothetical protein DRR19_31625 [Candidatus Parabeggiatoa sp. nov. 1]|nr:MAG: hypothetical protein DRR19_31625 [Gammaproteobacteria bacterium]